MDTEKLVKIEHLLRVLVRREMQDLLQWKPIADAPTNGSPVIVYVSAKSGLPHFITWAAYDDDAGWCVDELREATHFIYFKELLPLSPKEPHS